MRPSLLSVIKSRTDKGIGINEDVGILTPLTRNSYRAEKTTFPETLARTGFYMNRHNTEIRVSTGTYELT